MTQYTFPADIDQFVDTQAIFDGAFPVGLVLLLETETNPADLGLPGTWEEVE